MACVVAWHATPKSREITPVAGSNPVTVRLPLAGAAASPGESGAQSGKHVACDSSPSQLRSPQHEIGAGAEEHVLPLISHRPSRQVIGSETPVPSLQQ